jgi:hypothetical protein
MGKGQGAPYPLLLLEEVHKATAETSPCQHYPWDFPGGVDKGCVSKPPSSPLIGFICVTLH